MSLPLYSEKNRSGGLSKVRSILAVAAGKGGVGKSLVSANLALALSQLNYKVGLLDADLYGPSMMRMMRADQAPRQKGEGFIPALSHGVKLLSMAYFREFGKAAAVRAPIANQLIRQFLHQTDWGELDLLILDFPPGTGDIQMTLSQQAPLGAALMVSTPQEVAIEDVNRAKNLFDQLKVPILGLVENMAYLETGQGQKLYPFGKGGGLLSQKCALPLLLSIPLLPELSKCADEGTPFVFKEPKHPLSQSIMNLAQMVIDQLSKPESPSHAQSIDLTWKEMETV